MSTRATTRTKIASALRLIADALETEPDAAPLPEWVTIDAAGELAHVSVRTLHDARRAGQLVMSGTSRTRVVERASLIAWIESRRVRVRVRSTDDMLAARADELASGTA